MMEYREFEKLGVSPSLLGFGCMRFPLLDNGKIDEVEAERMIDHAIKSGVTYIDTAYPYHEGDSEPFVGKVLKKYNRNQFYLATKLPIWEVKSKEDVRTIFEAQLKRLDVEYVDFYLLHALDKEKWQTVIDLDIIHICEELREEGKIKHLGFSFHDEFDVFKEIINYHKWDFCQLQLNYLDMDIQAGEKGVHLANQLEIPIIVMEPIKGGTLASLPQEVGSLFTDYDKSSSLSSWALRYVANLPGIKVILSGMSTFEQLEDNLKTFNHYKPLTTKEAALIEKVKETLKSRTQNGCTGCAYCMPCPFDVHIPNNFRYWNMMYISGNEEMYKKKYSIMDEKSKASQCQECGLCEKMCPQHILIREDLKKVAKDMK